MLNFWFDLESFFFQSWSDVFSIVPVKALCFEVAKESFDAISMNFLVQGR